MNKLILCDVDGVLANFVNGVIASLNLSITHDHYSSWDHHKKLGFTDDQLWEPTKEAGWWLSLHPYPWARSLLTELRRVGDVVFSTSPSLDEKCPSEKVQWLRNHGFMEHDRNDYMIGKHKHLMAKSGALLIDDSDANVEAYREAGGMAVLFPQPWNKNRDLLSKTDRVSFVLENVYEWA